MEPSHLLLPTTLLLPNQSPDDLGYTAPPTPVEHAPPFYSQIKDEAPPHYFKYYFDYNKSKKSIKSLSAGFKSELGEGMGSDMERADVLDAGLAKFRTFFRAELEKINKFSVDRAQWIIDQQYDQVSKCDAILKKSKFSDSDKQTFLATLNEKLVVLAAEIIHLDRYVRANLKIGARVVTLFRASLQNIVEDLPSSFVGQIGFMLNELENEKFCNLDIDSLILFLSVCFAKSRDVSEFSPKKQKGGSVWTPPTSFVRNTTKYWVSPDRLVDCKCAIIKHMPFLIFGESIESFAEQLKDKATSRELCIAQDEPIDSQLVSSVYLDSASGYSYRQRIMRYEGAPLVRYRWYGSNGGEDTKKVFIERKTHHEGWTGLDSTKERFILNQKEVPGFLDGSMSPTDLSDILSQEKYKSQQIEMDTKKLAHEIYNLQRNALLEPMLRTSYHRCAFQLATNNQVRFSLDHNLCMIDERTHEADNKPSSWCKKADEILQDTDLVRFPFAVLEVKLQTEQPEWVTDMLESCGAIAVHKFSKFQHGMAQLHPDAIEGAPIPHWTEECMVKDWTTGFQAPGPAQAFDGELNPHALESIGARLYDPTFLRSMLTSVNPNSIQMPSFRSMGGMAKNHRDQAFQSMAALWSVRQPSQFNSNVHDIKSRFLMSCNQESLMAGKASKQSNGQKTAMWYTMRKEENARQRENARMMLTLDPKVQFATERVFLKYTRKALYLLPLIYICLDQQSFLAATLIYFISVTLLVYGWVQFVKRIGVLEMDRVKGTSIDDRPYIHSVLGPRLLFTLLCLAYSIYWAAMVLPTI